MRPRVNRHAADRSDGAAMSESESAFWRFSLRFYQRPDVGATCLNLQDQHGIDVNLLFFILFLAVNGCRITVADVRRIDACVGAWRERVVQPLRAIRRNLKGGISPIDTQSTEALRSAIKRDELLAERLQQETLEREFPATSTGTIAEPRRAAMENIAAYGSIIGTLPQAAIDHLLAALAEEFSV